MRLLDEQHLRRPHNGSRAMTAWLRREGETVNRKRVQRLMRVMGIESLAPGPAPRVATENMRFSRTFCET